MTYYRLEGIAYMPDEKDVYGGRLNNINYFNSVNYDSEELTGISFNSFFSLHCGNFNFLKTNNGDVLIYTGKGFPFKQLEKESLEEFFLRVAIKSGLLTPKK